MKRVISVSILLLFLTTSVDAVIPAKYLGEKLSPDATIASFTKTINSGRYRGEQLAHMYSERAIQYGKLRHFDQAVRDFSSAIEINPNNTRVYIRRASARASLQDYKGAFSDYDSALRLGSANMDVFKARGTLNFVLGKYANAITDFKQYLRFNPKDMYRIAWLFLSEKYNQQSVSSIGNYMNGLNTDQWPGAILKLYAGEVSLQEVLDAFKNNQLNMSAGHACETYFYLGQYLLLNNDKINAKRFFGKAVKTQATRYIEYQFSLAYIDKL